MAHFLLCPSGSHGDVHPFIAVGHALQARGHDVVLSTSVHFASLAHSAGLEFDGLGTETDFQETVNNPDLWHPTKSLNVLFGGERFRRLFREHYESLRRRTSPTTVIVAGSLCLSARLAHEALGVPLATVHLQPMAMPSVSDPAAYPSVNPKRWPRWLIRLINWYGERQIIDPIMAPAINELRCELGLPTITRVFGPWRHSPQCILGLFPEWFGQARDWPAHMTCTGFVRYDQSDTASLSPELDAFLKGGEAPVVISFGSAMRTGRPYFEAAVTACQSAGKRGVLLARSGDQIPPLPPTVFHADYVPFSKVFSRAAVAVHHGGVGTCAQALAAGVPQLIMPLAFDQFDNAQRLVDLGVARSVPAKKFTAKRATRALRELLADPGVPQRCAAMQEKMRVDAMPAIVARLETLAAQPTKMPVLSPK